MTRSPRRAALPALILAAGLALALAGCTSETAPAAPTPSPAEPAPDTATPAAEPADPLEDVVAAVLRPDVIELRDAGDAVVAEVDFMGDATEAIGALTTVFDAEPVSEPVEGNLEFPGGVRHDWEGFSLMETHYDEAQRVEKDLDNLLWPRLIVQADAPEVGGVAITSTAGRVGDRVDELAAPVDPERWTCSGWAAETLEVTRAGGTTNTVGVGLSFSGGGAMLDTPPSADETVTLLRAPEHVAQGCV